MNPVVMILMVIYPIGFLLTLTFFKFFGERVGMGGYDNQDEKWPDDWESNDEAFFGFSLAWFMVMPVLILFGLFKLLFLFSKWFLKLGVKKHKICKHKIDGLCPYPNVHCAYPDCEKN